MTSKTWRLIFYFLVLYYFKLLSESEKGKYEYVHHFIPQKWDKNWKQRIVLKISPFPVISAFNFPAFHFSNYRFPIFWTQDLEHLSPRPNVRNNSKGLSEVSKGIWPKYLLSYCEITLNLEPILWKRDKISLKFLNGGLCLLGWCL